MCSSISALVLIIVNLLVLILGIAVAVFGAIAQWGRTLFSETTVPFIAKALSNGAGPKAEISFSQISTLMGQYLTYLNAAGLVIFIFGLVLILIALVGMCGACKKNKCLLIIYIIFITVLFLGMVALTLLVRFARGDLEAKGRTLMEKNIKDTFVGINGGSINAPSAVLSLIQARLDCCGVNNGTIFQDAKNWNKTYIYKNTTINLIYPISCCKMKSNSYDPIDDTCFTNPNKTNSNYQTGCLAKLAKMVDLYSWFVIYGLIGLDVFLLLLIIFSIIIIRSVSKKEMKA